MSPLEEHLCNPDMPFMSRIRSLITADPTLTSDTFIRLGEDLLKRASDKDVSTCSRDITRLEAMIRMKKGKVRYA